MAGKVGASGAPGKPKSDPHRARIKAALVAYWNSPEGQAERARRRQEWREFRLAKRVGEP